MKLKLLCSILSATLGTGSMAAVILLPPGPLYFQFTNLEQTALGVNSVGVPLNNTNTYTGCSGAPEGNWGVAQVSVIRAGSVNPTGAITGMVGNDINSLGSAPFFSDQVFPVIGGQVTAMFYGTVTTSISKNGTVNSLQSTGGFIDLFWDDPTLSNTIVNISTLTPGMRTGDASFAGVTDGMLLGRLSFASGINPSNPTTDIQGTVDTALANNSGSADSYANVVDVNGDGVINALDGLWARQLNSDWFGTVFGPRDIRFSNKIDNNPNWDGQAGVTGQTSNDPGRAFVVPEPNSLTLISLGLLALGTIGRKRNT